MSEQPAVAAPVAAPVPLPNGADSVATSVAVEAPPPVVGFTPPEPPPSLVNSTPAEQPASPESPQGESATAPDAAQPLPAPEAVAAEPAAEPPAEPTPEPIAYEAFNFGEGVEMPADDPHLARFTEIAGAELHLPQEQAQKLIDIWGEAARDYAQTLERQMAERQWNGFIDTVKGWEKQFREDPDFVNRQQTVLENANWVLSQFGGSAAHRAEFDDIMRGTGIGNHRAQIRLLDNIAKFVRPLMEEPRRYQGEGRAPSVTANRGTAAERRYPKMGE